MIELKNVGKVYNASDGDHRALNNINLTIADGDMFGIIGESGAGKSTLVRHLNLLERPTEGRVIIDGVDITDFQGKQLRELRASIGMIFQNFSLFQQRTVLQNVMFPLEVRREPKQKSIERAHELLRMVSLDDKAQRYPSELSGGQQQRVAIARALANRPRYMLCDEATSALDSRTTMQVLDLLADINAELGVTMVLITHSLAVARRVCNRIAVIDSGRIVEEGATDDVFSNPQSSITRELLGFGESSASARSGEQAAGVGASARSGGQAIGAAASARAGEQDAERGAADRSGEQAAGAGAPIRSGEQAAGVGAPAREGELAAQGGDR